jgi:DNA repair protein SbcD/Mre11
VPTETVRILHLSDLHLGYSPSALGDKESSRRRERDTVLRRAVDLAIGAASRVDLVIIAGDLFDVHRPDAALVSYAIGELQRLVTANVPVVTVPGNHDEITYNDSVYRLDERRWPGVLVTNPMPDMVATFDIRGIPIHIYSLAYTGGVTETAPPLSRFPHTGAAGLHVASFHGSLGWDAGDRSLPIDRAALIASGYDYVALGHFHRESDLQLGSGGKAVYAGMTEGRSFSDPGTGQFVIAEIGSGRVTLEHLPAGARQLLSQEVDITGASGPADVEAAIRSTLKGRQDAIVRVKLTGSPATAIDLDAVTAGLGDLCYYLELEAETSELSDEYIATLAKEPTIRGEFVRRIAARAGDTEAALLRRALARGLKAMEGGVAR